MGSISTNRAEQREKKERNLKNEMLCWRAVKVPLMPKGVEHKIKRFKDNRIGAVKVPLMPKGVEH